MSNLVDCIIGLPLVLKLDLTISYDFRVQASNLLIKNPASINAMHLHKSQYSPNIYPTKSNLQIQAVVSLPSFHWKVAFPPSGAKPGRALYLPMFCGRCSKAHEAPSPDCPWDPWALLQIGKICDLNGDHHGKYS
jgi:hypothetical protein